MFDRNLNLNLDIQLPNIIKAFSLTFGDDYKDLIDDRLSDCRIIYYMNEKTYKDYFDFLVNCKIKELRIKFYNDIGLSYDKYKTEYTRAEQVEIEAKIKKLKSEGIIRDI